MSQHQELGEWTVTEEQKQLIRQQIAGDCNDAEFAFYLGVCKKYNADPFMKHIFPVRRKGKIVYQSSIEYYRLCASRSGEYGGSDDPVFDNEATPRKATVTVHRIVKGIRCPTTASARWSQYYPGNEKGQGWAWEKMPHVMLGKCAEALALRKAFPAEIGGGVYVKEELESPEEPVVIVEEISSSPPPPPASTGAPPKAVEVAIKPPEAPKPKTVSDTSRGGLLDPVTKTTADKIGMAIKVLNADKQMIYQHCMDRFKIASPAKLTEGMAQMLLGDLVACTNGVKEPKFSDTGSLEFVEKSK